jgi:hypothetical protein
MYTNSYEVTYYFTFFSCSSLLLTQFLPGKFTFYDRFLKSIPRVALVRKAADEISTAAFFKITPRKKSICTKTINKLTNNFAGLVISSMGPNMARGPPAGQQ